jgi:hypothetical protein
MKSVAARNLLIEMIREEKLKLFLEGKPRDPSKPRGYALDYSENIKGFGEVKVVDWAVHDAGSPKERRMVIVETQDGQRHAFYQSTGRGTPSGPHKTTKGQWAPFGGLAYEGTNVGPVKNNRPTMGKDNIWFVKYPGNKINNELRPIGEWLEKALGDRNLPDPSLRGGSALAGVPEAAQPNRPGRKGKGMVNTRAGWADLRSASSVNIWLNRGGALRKGWRNYWSKAMDHPKGRPVSEFPGVEEVRRRIANDIFNLYGIDANVYTRKADGSIDLPGRSSQKVPSDFGKFVFTQWEFPSKHEWVRKELLNGQTPNNMPAGRRKKIFQKYYTEILEAAELKRSETKGMQFEVNVWRDKYAQSLGLGLDDGIAINAEQRKKLIDAGIDPDSNKGREKLMPRKDRKLRKDFLMQRRLDDKIFADWLNTDPKSVDKGVELEFKIGMFDKTRKVAHINGESIDDYIKRFQKFVDNMTLENIVRSQSAPYKTRFRAIASALGIQLFNKSLAKQFADAYMTELEGRGHSLDAEPVKSQYEAWKKRVDYNIKLYKKYGVVVRSGGPERYRNLKARFIRFLKKMGARVGSKIVVAAGKIKNWRPSQARWKQITKSLTNRRGFVSLKGMPRNVTTPSLQDMAREKKSTNKKLPSGAPLEIKARELSQRLKNHAGDAARKTMEYVKDSAKARVKGAPKMLKASAVPGALDVAFFAYGTYKIVDNDKLSLRQQEEALVDLAKETAKDTGIAVTICVTTGPKGCLGYALYSLARLLDSMIGGPAPSRPLAPKPPDFSATYRAPKPGYEVVIDKSTRALDGICDPDDPEGDPDCGEPEDAGPTDIYCQENPDHPACK